MNVDYSDLDEPFDADHNHRMVTEIVSCVKAVMDPPPNGVPFHLGLRAIAFKVVLEQAGYAIVPLSPSPKMSDAFRSGWLKPFVKRYAAMLAASRPAD